MNQNFPVTKVLVAGGVNFATGLGPVSTDVELADLPAAVAANVCQKPSDLSSHLEDAVSALISTNNAINSF